MQSLQVQRERHLIHLERQEVESDGPIGMSLGRWAGRRRYKRNFKYCQWLYCCWNNSCSPIFPSTIVNLKSHLIICSNQMFRFLEDSTYKERTYSCTQKLRCSLLKWEPPKFEVFFFTWDRYFHETINSENSLGLNSFIENEWATFTR